MSWGPAKRFWQEVSLKEEASGITIQLDTRPLRTPAKAVLSVPNRRLAEEIAQEWRSVEGEINPKTMRFTRAANAAIDKVAQQHGDVAALLAAYGETDLLCYRATDPVELIARQIEAWDPLLDWAEYALGARLVTTQGVLPVAQDVAALKTLSDQVHAFDAFEMTAFHDLVSLSGSLVLAFAVTHRRIDPEFAWSVSRIDETFQEQQWGIDDEASALSARKKADFDAAAQLYFLLRDG